MINNETIDDKTITGSCHTFFEQLTECYRQLVKSQEKYPTIEVVL